MRVLVISGYTHPSHHRKVEVLADAPDVDLLHIVQPGSGKEPGLHASASGRRHYRVEVLPVRSLGQPGDPHRTIHWPPDFRLRQFRPHLIHCEHEQESLMAAEVALARATLAPGVPLVLYSWQNILRQRTLPVRLLSSFTLRSAQHIICASREGVSVLQEQGYRGSASVIPLFGLDTRYVYRRSSPELRERLNLSGFVVGFAGRLVSEKGVDLLLRAAAQVQNHVHVLVVGDGPAKAELTALAAQLGIGEQCHFVGSITYDQVIDYVSLMDLLVLPSRTTRNWKEQFGRVLVEAMACKVAVVGSTSGAIPEVIADVGLTFPEGDALALANILNDLSADAEKRRTFAERGYTRALSKYTVEQIAQDTLSIWRQIEMTARH